jgi:hypothetical protein
MRSIRNAISTIEFALDNTLNRTQNGGDLRYFLCKFHVVLQCVLYFKLFSV